MHSISLLSRPVFGVFAAAIFLAACGIFPKNAQRADARFAEVLEQKSEPYDQRAQQLAWPDFDMDWAAYNRALERATAREKALRGAAGPCDGNHAAWKLEGPANIGGRVNSLVIKPDDENVLLAGFSTGGIFKSTNKGDDWRPVFDEHLNLSIGDLTFDPSNPNVVYAGTGDPNMPGTVFNGSGVFKSTDAGETWAYIGLAQAGIISKVVVNQSNPQVLFAAAMGNPYVRSAERGIYKSSDGGLTWAKVLFVSDQAGASDLVINPQNPNVLYASFWDRIRSSRESIISGEHARVYKSADGGQTWTHLTAGLPTGKWGRTGLAISQQNPQKVFAIYVDSLAKWPWIYKTENGGTSWTALNTIGLHSSYADFGWYFGKIRLNPSNDDDLYFLAIQLWRKAPGSTQFSLHGGMHADVHDLVFAPSGTRYSATDGGVYRNNPGQGPWTRCKNLPTTQFYHVNFNKWKPNEWYAGAQDNGVSSGNAQSLNSWEARVPSDGFTTQFHPWDQYNIWSMTQNGEMWRSNDGGANWMQGSLCLGQANDRCNWDTPILMSTHSNNQNLFGATHRVYQSDANGWPSWVSISADLTDGNIYGARFHTISCINESPITPLKLMAGTTDGNVWRRDAGGSWANVTGTLPDRYVTSVHLSPTTASRLFATHAGWRDNDYLPHIHRSDDNGLSWTDISGDLPQFPVYDLLVLPGHADSVLVCGTDIGVYFSKNSGQTWERLGEGLPNAPTFDLERNPVRKEIAAGTYGRGVWTYPIDSLFKQTESVSIGLAGKIQTQLAQGIGYVSVMAQTTDSTGRFSAQNLAGCQTYTLTPHRDDNPLNGVSTFDLLLISKHILGVEPLDAPLKILAADANRSRSVTSFDILALRKLILGIDTALAGNTSWRFLPANYIFKNPDNPLADTIPESITVNAAGKSINAIDFQGFKVGDINLNATPGLAAEAEERGQFAVFLENKNYLPGQSVEAIFSAETAGLNGLQFTLAFDPTALAFERIEPLLPGISAENFGTNRAAQGLLTACFEPENQPLAPHPAPLFRAHFRAKKAGALADALAFNSSVTHALAYQNGAAQKPVLAQKSAANASFVFAPTAFGKSGTAALAALPLAGEFDLQIIDNQGKLLFSRRTDLPAGAHRIEVPAAVFPSAGTYFFRAKLAGQAFSGRLIFQP